MSNGSILLHKLLTLYSPMNRVIHLSMKEQFRSARVVLLKVLLLYY